MLLLMNQAVVVKIATIAAAGNHRLRKIMGNIRKGSFYIVI
jgi:hypothetical protein